MNRISLRWKLILPIFQQWIESRSAEKLSSRTNNATASTFELVNQPLNQHYHKLSSQVAERHISCIQNSPHFAAPMLKPSMLPIVQLKFEGT